MSLGNWGQVTQNDVAGVASTLFGSAILRDYTHASKTFRSNSYQYAPKLKFLFHTYFELNTSIGNENEFGLLVKEVKLPSFSFQTAQMNQYNRKRIVQTKIKYDPIEITFHDDNGNVATRLWEAYYQYYYNDSTKPGSVLAGPGVGSSTADYNTRNIYNPDISGNDDWGFNGGQNSGDGVKVPFFKNITVFGFNQHNFTSYTLINPVITGFGHDTYNYAEGGGTMSNRMTIDYETVVYNYGAMDGRNPGNIVKGFGDQSHYDTLPSPIAGQGTGTVLGQGGLVDAAGGFISSLESGNILGAVTNAMSAYNSINQITQPGNNLDIGNEVLNGLLRTTLGNTPDTRNTLFSVPVAASSPGPAGLAGSPTIGARPGSTVVTSDAVQTVNGVKYSATTPYGGVAAPNFTDTELLYSQLDTLAGYQYTGNDLTYPLGDTGFATDLPFGGATLA